MSTCLALTFVLLHICNIYRMIDKTYMTKLHEPHGREECFECEPFDFFHFFKKKKTRLCFIYLNPYEMAALQAVSQPICCVTVSALIFHSWTESVYGAMLYSELSLQTWHVILNISQLLYFSEKNLNLWKLNKVHVFQISEPNTPPHSLSHQCYLHSFSLHFCNDMLYFISFQEMMLWWKLKLEALSNNKMLIVRIRKGKN